MLPDPSFFADCLRAAFEQMLEAAEREAAFTVATEAAAATQEAPAKGNGKSRTIEGHVVRKPRKRPVRAAKPGRPKRRMRKPAAEPPRADA